LYLYDFYASLMVNNYCKAVDSMQESSANHHKPGDWFASRRLPWNTK